MTAKEILRTILSELRLEVKQFSEQIDYPASKLYDIQRGKTIKLKEDLISRIVKVYPQYNRIWLMTGEGDSKLHQSMPSKDTVGKKSDNQHGHTKTDTTECIKTPTAPNNLQLIPFVEQTAVAGFGNDNFSILQQDIKEYYVVPKFRHNRVDFMIEISGSSMYPKYNSGDVVACTILHDNSFIQWNKCHVIATREQGILCKRIAKTDNPEILRLVSDNTQYPPFDVPKSEITGIALVVGVIRLE